MKSNLCSRIVSAGVALCMAAAAFTFHAPVKAASTAPLADRYIAKTYTNEEKFPGEVLRYRIYIPEDYDETKAYPLFLNLHGSGEWGTDNFKQVNCGGTMPLKLVQDDVAKKYPCIVIAPQARDGEYWAPAYSNIWFMSTALEMTVDLIEQLNKYYNIDRNRLYVSGNSIGGTGTWDLITRFPDMFAAAAPLCGYTNEVVWDKAERIKDLPIRVYHADGDPIMSVEYSRDMVNALKAAGSNVEYFEVKSNDHGAGWYSAYDDPELLPWLFSQKKNGNYPEFVPPVRDESALCEEIAKAEKADSESEFYTSQSAKLLTNALKAAKQTKLDKQLSQPEIDKAAKVLSDAINGLEYAAVDYAALNAAVKKAEGINPAFYTEESVAALTEALSKVKEFLKQEKVTQKAIDGRTSILEFAIKSLVRIPTDTYKLTITIEAAETVNLSMYTVESAKVFSEALRKAKETCGDPNSLQDQIDTAERDLTAAMKNLMKKAVKSTRKPAPKKVKGIKVKAKKGRAAVSFKKVKGVKKYYIKITTKKGKKVVSATTKKPVKLIKSKKLKKGAYKAIVTYKVKKITSAPAAKKFNIKR